MPKRSKKETIAELLMMGNLTHEQIALQANTKVAYVTKTKSVLMKEGKLPRLADARQSTKGSVPPSVEYAMDRMQEKMMGRNVDSNAISPNPLSEENLKKLYFAFGSDFLPHQIIATTGLPPAIVEIEYERYLRFKGRDIAGFQKSLYSIMTSCDFADERLAELSKGQLPINELVNLTEEFAAFQVNEGFQLSVENRFSPLPEGWKRILCPRCGVPLVGVIIKPTEAVGKAFANLLTSSPKYARKCTCENTYEVLEQNMSLNDQRARMEREFAEKMRQKTK